MASPNEYCAASAPTTSGSNPPTARPRLNRTYDRPAENANAAEIVAEQPEDETACHRTYQRPSHERAGLSARQSEIGTDGCEDESKNEQVEPVHRISDRGPKQCSPLIGSSSIRFVR
jgi:hypothetical protein